MVDSLTHIIDLKIGCYRHLGNCIQRCKRENEQLYSLEAFEYNEPYTEDIRIDNTQQEKEVDEIIDRMNLTIKERETLLCYMAGMGYIEIAKHFMVTNTTIWYRRQRIQRKYNALAELEKKIANVESTTQNVDDFIRNMKKYLGVPELTREMCYELIDRIIVGGVPKDKDEQRMIEIIYKVDIASVFAHRLQRP